MMNNEIMTISQVANYLRVSDKTVRRLIKDNRLTASKVGSCWRIRKEDISRYLDRTANTGKGPKDE